MQRSLDVFRNVAATLDSLGLRVSSVDDGRPWGGFFVIEEGQAAAFMDTFFPGLDPSHLSGFRKLSPKILLVAPGKRLSWQYHHRRSELWQVVSGTVAVAVSDTDRLPEPRVMPPGSRIEVAPGQRHRLMGLEEWGVVAEIWRHTDPAAPSDEEDIVRLEDDFGRE
jgi:mannose-6-phosphate isomerase